MQVRLNRRTLHPHLACIGQGGIFLSAKMWRMHKENDGRYVITNVLAWREDSAAVICLHRKPHTKSREKKKAGYQPAQQTKEEKGRKKKKSPPP